MAETINKLVQSAWLVALARVLTVLASTVGIGGVTWVVNSSIEQNRRQAIFEIRLAQLEIERAEQKRNREADASLIRDVQHGLVRAIEKLDAQARALSRIENFIDRQGDRPRP